MAVDEQTTIDLDRADAYGRSFDDVYDRWYHDVTDAEATADHVLDQHPGGVVVELGVGSGRLAEPLARRGLTVVGIDGSASMLARCPRRPSNRPGLATGGPGGTGPTDPTESTDRAAGSTLPVLADLRALPLAGRGLVGTVLVAFNTLFNLSSETDQARLLADVATGLRPDGRLLVEALDVTPLLDGPERSIGIRNRTATGLIVTATQLDTTTQQVDGHHLEIDDDGIRVRPWRLRWLTPNQLDDLAGRAGLRLDRRVGSWTGEPFAGPGSTHISSYRRV